MKIRKIYSNKSFHNTTFNLGMNVVLGKPTRKDNYENDTHNLGKTSLLYLIDFLLLKGVDKNNPLIKSSKNIDEYIFYGEFEVSDKKIFTIKRKIIDPNKINLFFSELETVGFDTKLKWTHKNLSFDKAKKILNDYIGFSILDDWDFRKSIGYFLRSQNDYTDVFQLSKFQGKHINWKPFLFELLGFDGNLLNQKYQLDDQKKKLKDYIAIVNERFLLKSNETDKLRGLIQIKKEEIKETQEKIDNFEFYLEDIRLNKRLLENIDEQITLGNTQRYNLTSELESIKKSLKISSDEGFDLEEVNSIYKEVNILFPKEYIKTLDDLKKFQKKITKDREKYLLERKKQLEKDISEIEKELFLLNKKQSKLLEVLKDKNSYEKFKYYQKSLVESETEIVQLNEKLKNMIKVNEIEEQIDEISDEIKETKNKIKSAIDMGSKTYQQIRRNFNSYVKEVLNVPAIISITPNNSGNVEFSADIQNPADLEITAESYGTTYKKVLCALFDLSLLTTYRNEKFYKFVYHDGILEGLDDRKKVKFINLVKKLVAEHSIQYMLSIIDSDLPSKEFNEFEGFSNEEIVITLHDESNDGKLFKKSF